MHVKYDAKMIKMLTVFFLWSVSPKSLGFNSCYHQYTIHYVITTKFTKSDHDNIEMTLHCSQAMDTKTEMTNKRKDKSHIM